MWKYIKHFNYVNFILLQATYRVFTRASLETLFTTLNFERIDIVTEILNNILRKQRKSWLKYIYFINFNLSIKTKLNC